MNSTPQPTDPGLRSPGPTGSGTEDYDDDGCYQCGGAGYIVTCIDDLCRGSGECIHGDGEQPCPACCGQSPNSGLNDSKSQYPVSGTGNDPA